MRPEEDIREPSDVLVEINDGPLHDWAGVRRVVDGEDRLVLEQAGGNTIVYHDRAWLSYVAGEDVEVSATPGVSGSPTQVGQERVTVSKGTADRHVPDFARCAACDSELGPEWVRADERAKNEGEHPAPCPECGGNPLPPVGEDEED